MIVLSGFGAENHGAAFEIFNDKFEVSVVEDVADSEAAADLRDLNGRASECTNIAELPVMQVLEE